MATRRPPGPSSPQPSSPSSSSPARSSPGPSSSSSSSQPDPAPQRRSPGHTGPMMRPVPLAQRQSPGNTGSMQRPAPASTRIGNDTGQLQRPQAPSSPAAPSSAPSSTSAQARQPAPVSGVPAKKTVHEERTVVEERPKISSLADDDSLEQVVVHVNEHGERIDESSDRMQRPGTGHRPGTDPFAPKLTADLDLLSADGLVVDEQDVDRDVEGRDALAAEFEHGSTSPTMVVKPPVSAPKRPEASLPTRTPPKQPERAEKPRAFKPPPETVAVPRPSPVDLGGLDSLEGALDADATGDLAGAVAAVNVLRVRETDSPKTGTQKAPPPSSRSGGGGVSVSVNAKSASVGSVKELKDDDAVITGHDNDEQSEPPAPPPPVGDEVPPELRKWKVQPTKTSVLPPPRDRVTVLVEEALELTVKALADDVVTAGGARARDHQSRLQALERRLTEALQRLRAKERDNAS